jgi:putative FmdB family regulatory protein
VPTYDYQCRACGHTIEVIHSMTEEGPSTCDRCGGELRRVLYPTGIIFKGSGFYKTDSRASTASSSSSAKRAPEKANAPKADSGSTGAADTSPKTPPAPSTAQEGAGS